MKTIHVVAAVICDGFDKNQRFLRLQEDMEISKETGSFQEGK